VCPPARRNFATSHEGLPSLLAYVCACCRMVEGVTGHVGVEGFFDALASPLPPLTYTQISFVAW